MQIIKGDLFEIIKKEERKIVIPHVVNVQNSFGSGFAKAIWRAFQTTKLSYHRNTDRLYAFFEPLEILGQNYEQVINEQITVVHMYAQDLGGVRPLYYNALVKCMSSSFFNKKVIYCPKFRSGLAGGNWDFISELIYDIWERSRNNEVNVCSLE